MIGWSPTARSAQASAMATTSSRAVRTGPAVVQVRTASEETAPAALASPCQGAGPVRASDSRDLVMLTGLIASRMQGGAGRSWPTGALLRGLGRTIHSAARCAGSKDSDEQTS